MSPLWGHLVGVMTVVTLLVFLAIWVWAWSPWHRARFDDLARLPMMDGVDEPQSATPSEDRP